MVGAVTILLTILSEGRGELEGGRSCSRERMAGLVAGARQQRCRPKALEELSPRGSTATECAPKALALRASLP